MKITQVQTASPIKPRRSINTSSFGNSNVSFQGWNGTGYITGGGPRGTNGVVSGATLTIYASPLDAYPKIKSHKRHLYSYQNLQISTSRNEPPSESDGLKVNLYYAEDGEYIPKSIEDSVDMVITGKRALSPQELANIRETKYKEATEKEQITIKENKEQIEKENQKLNSYERMKQTAEDIQLYDEAKRYEQKINEIQDNIKNNESKIQTAEERLKQLEFGKTGQKLLEETTAKREKAKGRIKYLQQEIESCPSRIEAAKMLGYQNIIEEEINKKNKIEAEIKEQQKLYEQLNNQINDYRKSMDLYKQVVSVYSYE